MADCACLPARLLRENGLQAARARRRLRRRLDGREIDVAWQLQRVRWELLHRETKTEASDAKTLKALKRLGKQFDL